MKSTLTLEFEHEEQDELKSIVGVRDLQCACCDFESRLRELWKYDNKGMEDETIDKIRDLWFDCTENVRWVLE